MIATTPQNGFIVSNATSPIVNSSSFGCEHVVEEKDDYFDIYLKPEELRKIMKSSSMLEA